MHPFASSWTTFRLLRAVQATAIMEQQTPASLTSMGGCGSRPGHGTAVLGGGQIDAQAALAAGISRLLPQSCLTTGVPVSRGRLRMACV